MGVLNIASFVCLLVVCTAGPASRPKRSTTCYENLDCFSIEAPFNNTDGLHPQSPDVIDTTFRLFTSSCPDPRILSADQITALAECNFDPSLPIKFIIHGFLQYGEVQWVRDMAAELLIKEPMTVISVDWGSGSGFPYSQAAANTRIVGAELARLINFLHNNQGARLDKFHLIGHSVGAHVAGYAGQRVPGLARITGLDPAEPDYKGTDPIVHLDTSDANFVDIIHSDGSEFDYVSGFGWIDQLGHIDFYPNGGEDQPGCPKESVRNIMSAAYYHGLEDAEDTLSCSHSRSIYLFLESINSPCPFYGHPCENMAALDSNLHGCLRCRGGVCPTMGYNADRTNSRGKFYLRTRGAAPFCGESQHVDVEFGNMDETTGQILLTIVGHDRSTDTVIINSGRDAFLSGEHREALVVDRERVDHVAEIRVTFARATSYTWWWSSANTTPFFVTISKITITAAEDGRSIHFCGEHRTITNGNTISLTRSTTDPNECLHTVHLQIHTSF